MPEVGGVEVLATDKSKDSAWCPYNYRWLLLLKLLNLALNGLAAVKNISRYFLFVHVLGESVVLFLDLEG